MSNIFNESYYNTYSPKPYNDAEYWARVFQTIADNIIKDFNPKTVLDAGCAMGYLVAALRDRGVEAYGIDISEYAISKVREDIRQYCFTGSLTDTLPPILPARFDLVITIEVLEHLSEDEGGQAINSLCSYTDNIIFSSTPDDIAEDTHINVQKSDYWARLFAENGFYNNADYIPLYISPYAILFSKNDNIPEHIAKYERRLQSCNAAYQSLYKAFIGNAKCFGKIYLDTGSGYAENEVINLNESPKEYFNYIVELPAGVRSIRFDPIDGTACIIKNLVIKSDARDLEYTCNGIAIENYTLFSSTDPQYEIKPVGPISHIEISGEIFFISDIVAKVIRESNKRVFSAAQEITNAQSRITLLNEENLQLKNDAAIAEQNISDLQEQITKITLKYESVINSLSWKLTKPLRFGLRMIRNAYAKTHYIRKFFNHNVKYYIDRCEFSDNILTISGWIFLMNSDIEKIQLVLSSNNKDFYVNISTGIRRSDVFSSFNNEHAMNSGFKALVRIEKCAKFNLFLQYITGPKRRNIYLGTFTDPAVSDHKAEPVITTIEYDQPVINIETWIKKNTIDHTDYPSKLYEEPVDIIIPVYNGFEFLDSLFSSIVNTGMQYRLIIVNDKSTDERVSHYLHERFKDDKSTVLFENESNLGFVKSVNKAFRISKHHVVIVNTDTELPEMWLERIMAPIILNKNVASATPYTNAGTICSFPKIGLNNKLFEGLPLGVIDKAFQQIRPFYCPIPTGVGFCMAINKEALARVGFFDADTFSKGYGEENDWCQRAIQLGYKNVMVENLFVYHKHGGSFTSEEKQQLLEQNQKLLLKKHPNYLKDVTRFFEADPQRPVRNFIIMQLSFGLEKKPMLMFDHNIGGGAASYANKKVKTLRNEGYPVMLVRYDAEHDIYLLHYKYDVYEFSYSFVSLDFFHTFLAGIALDTIYINELVTYPEIYNFKKKIIEIKKASGAKLVFLFHDFFALCPSCNLLNEKRLFCGLKPSKDCNVCLKANKMLSNSDYETREKWLENWNKFLLECDDIIVFSNSSAELVKQVYGNTLRISVLPHKIKDLPAISKLYKTTKTLNIGLLGVLSYHKGAKIIKQMLNIIKQDNLKAKIVLIGSSDEKIDDPNFIKTGKYSLDMVPKLVYQYDVDLFFISSIWPETFSYTTEEAIKFNMPVIAFNIGAPGERIKHYAKGQIIEDINAKTAVNTILQFSHKVVAKVSPYINKRILFVTEQITFSSRYRVEHLQEQLLIKGITSKFVEIKDIGNYDMADYHRLFIYRCSYSDKLKKKIDEAKWKDRRVIYDIDDYIFDFDAIKNLDFLKKDEYKSFESYSNKLSECMALCDGFMTSTVNLKVMIEKSFVNKPVCVNRNVASMEMVILSLDAIENVNKADSKVILGYFSGTKTHDKDFLLIKDVLLELLEKNDNLYLKLVGVIETENEFSRFEDRIERSGFIDWRLLPELIASVDINLMPLEDTVFHACKSENKWMEAALVKVPTVASYNTELERVIQNGETGYLCRTPEEWKSVLNSLISDRGLRQSIAQSAYNKVSKDYTTANISPEVIDFIMGSNTSTEN